LPNALPPSCERKNCNLDRNNPQAKQDFTHKAPEKLVESILERNAASPDFGQHQEPA
jgi:hypothetical protein